MLVDTGSLVDIMYLAAYDRLGLPHNLLKPACTPLIGAIVSRLHLKMKFPTTGGVGEVSGDQKKDRVCYQQSIPRGTSLKDPPKQKRHKEGPPEVMKTVQPGGQVPDNSSRERKS
ncbi:hypothetical protein LIER_00232 [Lithospermum erythrorhizon]|uniref:Uncharacterized protein n=1 Tax=Lithospermum erythrorhizon TaxID=34254 RepID=A0AAV3NGM2_LITER